MTLQTKQEAISRIASEVVDIDRAIAVLQAVREGKMNLIHSLQELKA
jgi:hypothetical protein